MRYNRSHDVWDVFDPLKFWQVPGKHDALPYDHDSHSRTICLVRVHVDNHNVGLPSHDRVHSNGTNTYTLCVYSGSGIHNDDNALPFHDVLVNRHHQLHKNHRGNDVLPLLKMLVLQNTFLFNSLTGHMTQSVYDLMLYACHTSARKRIK